VKLVSIPANPVPEGATLATLKTPDGVTLRAVRWPPPPGRKGTVCLFQGRTEYIEKYFEIVRDLRARGFAVATLDWRGQGLSERALRDRFKGHVGSFSEYDTDLATFMQEMVLPDCPPPHFAIAHSAGASVLIRAAYRGKRWFDRIVLTSPMIHLPPARLLGAAADADTASAWLWLALCARGQPGNCRAAAVRGQPSYVGPSALHARRLGDRGGP
jgi:lysophospholipase